MTTVEQDPRAELIADLRAFADLLEARPDMPVPREVSVQYSVLRHDLPGDADRLAEVERIAVRRDGLHAAARLLCGCTWCTP